MEKEISVCLTLDFDAMSVWLGTFGATSPSMISRGEFGRVGAERLLALLRPWGIRATWFVPGHTVETFPELVQRIADEGHEIGHHGYCHENPALLSQEEERAVLERGIDAIRRVAGKPPVGYRSPAWDLSACTLDLLLEHGFLYDSSLMAQDFTPYYCRVGDQAPKDGPYLFGREIELVEIPVTWGLDDFPPFEYVWTAKGINPGLSAPSQVYEVWSGDFDYLYERLGAGVFCLTLHPQVIGRGHRLLMLERLLQHMRERIGVSFRTMADVSRVWKEGHPLPGSR
ncbi:MAG: polysaccharide deacetylase [Candidatus Tectomicrobia bacterium]|uniref:Polysaccharide deacetylase n=1 Tax=Tectimicrobiota bacterium TaxID=2528274 RepID=A0A932FXW0_UNCTE|nr:polysaccharide deacetylase [Candidatus Tectomicrobia bacterium]